MPGAPTDTLPPFPCISDGFTSFTPTSFPSSPPKLQPQMLAAPLPSDGSATLRVSTNLLPRSVNATSKPPKKKKRAAVKPHHFVPRTMPNDNAATAENTRDSSRNQVEGVVTRARAKGRKDRKRYREDSGEDEADVDNDGERRQDESNASSEEDFM